MYSSELYKKYKEVCNQANELESKIDLYLDKWKNHEVIISDKVLEDAIDKASIRLENLKKLAQSIHDDFSKLSYEENIKVGSDILIRHKLQTSPTDMEITGGVLSKNASESHLFAKQKTSEQKEFEKRQMLDEVKQRVLNKELSLEEASNLVNAINNSYGYYLKEEEIKHRYI